MSNFKNEKDRIIKSGYQKAVYVKLQEMLGRQLVDSDVTLIIKYLKRIPDKIFVQHHNKDKFTDMLMAKLAKDAEDKYNDDNLDVKELLIEQMGNVEESGNSNDVYDKVMLNANRKNEMADVKQSFLGVDNIIDFSKIINPASATKTQYLILDSRFKNTVSSTSKKLVWDYSPDKNVQNGSFTLSGNVRDIISFKIFPFKLPYTKDGDTKRQLLTLFIEELATQAFIAQQNRKFNFVLYTTINAEFIEMTPVQENNGEFKLYKTLTRLDSMSITIGDPNKLITYTRDRDMMLIDYFSDAPNTIITTDNPHNLSNGDIVIISNFDYGTIDPILVDQIRENDLLKNAINSEDGYEAFVIAPNKFSISLDTSGIMAPLPFDIRFNVFYDSKRVYIPMQVEYINPVD